MSPETLSRIFNLFVSTKGSRGTGLGLTVSRKILKEHHGEIHAESRLGEGSTFTLEFPLLLAGEEGRVDHPFEDADDGGDQATLEHQSGGRTAHPPPAAGPTPPRTGSP
jgi:hypothetical protein